MRPSIGAAFLVSTVLAAAQTLDPQLTGTWSSKSKKTFTGPGFYDPVKDVLIEPSHTGISYSFTDDGFYEEAYYRAIANPVNPNCPKGLMQWQHGSYQKVSNGSLILNPIPNDGRQLFSDPCSYGDNAAYTRYNQSELFKRYEVLTDPYHNVLRLNLYKFDGSPVMPMYLAYKPPTMLPTTALKPTATASGGATSTASSKLKRALGVADLERKLGSRKQRQWADPDLWWWVGLASTGIGGVLYAYF